MLVKTYELEAETCQTYDCCVKQKSITSVAWQIYFLEQAFYRISVTLLDASYLVPLR